MSSTHCWAWKPRLASGPSESSQTVDPEMLVTAETTEAFSRDHLKVAVVSSPGWWISTR